LPAQITNVHQDVRWPSDVAIGLYWRILKQDERNVVALNNLAFLTSMAKGKHEEALDLINRVIKLAGPGADILDTRAVIFLKNNQPQQAVEDLQKAIEQRPHDPVYYFHLAQAHLRANAAPAAREALRKGQKMGLNAGSLHSLERALLPKLIDQLNLDEKNTENREQ
jgi:predicted Zn-dependent protease